MLIIGTLLFPILQFLSPPIHLQNDFFNCLFFAFLKKIKCKRLAFYFVIYDYFFTNISSVEKISVGNFIHTNMI